MPATSGDTVRVDYRGTLTDGTLFDTSEGHGPMEFQLGDGTVIEGFEAAVTGLEEGETRTVTIPPREAYGDRNENLVREYDLSEFGETPELGTRYDLVSEDGTTTLHGIVSDVSEDKVTIDLNHPLAGLTLVFEIELVELVKAPEPTPLGPTPWSVPS